MLVNDDNKCTIIANDFGIGDCDHSEIVDSDYSEIGEFREGEPMPPDVSKWENGNNHLHELDFD